MKRVFCLLTILSLLLCGCISDPLQSGKNPTDEETAGPIHTVLPTEPEQTDPNGAAGTSYILNTNSMKFHETTCSYGQSTSDRNRLDFTGPREEVIEMGYVPCKACNP